MYSYLWRSRGRALIFQGLLVLFAVVLSGCNAQTNGPSPGGSGTPAIPYHQGAGQIIVQLFPTPGFIYPPINGVPEWTLYGDGTLIFKPGASPVLMQAHLSRTEVERILNTIVNQNAFFATTRDTYGHIIPDTGSLLLSVSANGQHKEVRLYGEPSGPLDQETGHVFAIKRFLLGYYPANAQPYTPPGVALLVIPQTTASAVAAWPYPDISLAQVAAQECSFLQFGARTACTPETGGQSGIVPIYGKRGQALLQQWRDRPYTNVSQDGKDYQVIVWPLLPDALAARANGGHSITVQGENGGVWPLLPGYSK